LDKCDFFSLFAIFPHEIKKGEKFIFGL
jgi:hypothetical protein